MYKVEEGGATVMGVAVVEEDGGGIEGAADDEFDCATFAGMIVGFDYPLRYGYRYKENGEIRLRPLLGTSALSIMMTVVLAVVIYSAAKIFMVLHNSLSKSRRGLALQRQLCNTLLVQFSVPFFVMYVPVLVALFPPLLHIRLSIPSEFMLSMFSVYPSLDALVILLGVHDYRVAVLEMLQCCYPVHYTGNAVVSFTTMSIIHSNVVTA